MTVIYWIAAIYAVGLATVIHGDCVSGPAVERCIAEKRDLAGIGFAFAAVGYVLFIWWLTRKPGLDIGEADNTDSPLENTSGANASALEGEKSERSAEIAQQARHIW